MVLLLGSRVRSRGRGRSGVFSSLSRVVNTLLGRSNDSSVLLRRDARKSAVPWLALTAALLCFAGGYLTGSKFGAGKATDGEAGLNAGAPRTAGIIEVDTSPLSSEAFVVAIYQNIGAAEAKAKAKDLSDYLRAKGLPKARPYEFQTKVGPLWGVAVWVDGDEKDTRKRLLDLPPDVPDAVFASLRKTTEDWPSARPIR